ncbi:MAG TPA: hypothetical protein VIB60_05925, partial [Methylomirabilota bacterium]
ALQALALLVLGALSAAFLARRVEWLRRAVAERIRPGLDTGAPTGALPDPARDTLVAFGEILAVGRPLSPGERLAFLEEVDDQARTVPGQLAAYAMAAGLLDRLAGTRFAALDLRQRVELLVRHGLTSYPARTRECLWPFRREELAVRELAAPALITAYYRSAAGWAVVGYDVFPGRCGDPVRYTRAEP